MLRTDILQNRYINIIKHNRNATPTIWMFLENVYQEFVHQDKGVPIPFFPWPDLQRQELLRLYDVDTDTCMR